MLIELLNFCKNLLGIETKPKKSPVKKNNNVQDKETSVRSSKNNKTSQNSQRKKINIPTEVLNKNKYLDNPNHPKLEKVDIMKKIKKNIFHLNQLLEILEGNASYSKYYKKVRELKSQSEGCYKIVYRIKEEAPYLQATLRTILNHTDTISYLFRKR
jgi:hypothetical protein